MTMLMGAALHDATPEQVARLREEAKPLVHGLTERDDAGRYLVDWADVEAKVREIMPPGWGPSEEWKLADD